MKKLVGGLTLTVVLALAAPASAQTFVGGGLIYGADIDPFGLGIQAGAYVGMDDLLPGLRLGGDIEFYLPQSETVFGQDVTWNLLAINGNAQYFFLMGETFDAYALAGLSLGRLSLSGGGASESNTELDINLGGGIEVPMDFGRVYAELKIVAGDYDRIVLGAGVRFGL
jgi:hypothetical protein